MATVQEQFEARRERLESLTERLLEMVREHVLPDTQVDRIDGRVKSTQQFVAKANRVRDGKARYRKPLAEIQDQVGLRIMVRFDGDRVRLKTAVAKLFRSVESRFKQPEEADRFGYEATHLVCLVPLDLRQDSPIDFFEIQICTLFQHAWAECNHDVGYKSNSKLTRDQERRIALAAANAWGADRLFQELYDAQGNVHKPRQNRKRPLPASDHSKSAR